MRRPAVTSATANATANATGAVPAMQCRRSGDAARARSPRSDRCSRRRSGGGGGGGCACSSSTGLGRDVAKLVDLVRREEGHGFAREILGCAGAAAAGATPLLCIPIESHTGACVCVCVGGERELGQGKACVHVRVCACVRVCGRGSLWVMRFAAATAADAAAAVWW